MIIRIRENHTLALEDEDNFKGFCIRAQDSNTDLGALDGITKRVEEGNYWLDALAVIALSSKSTEKTWLDNFWTMLASAEPYGYADLKAQLVRAHIEYDIPQK
ncbi:MAG: hypothetical protein CL401_00680 [Acidiferrobacteraceae bacterium]|nr:hypothetical protein [Acidiferrobacteraceae bacterium]